MLNRKIDTFIERHYATEKKPLFLTGARQVGKSYAMEKYARAHFPIYVECNFYKEPQLTDIVQNATNEKDLLSKLSLYKMVSFVEGQTFIFFDEIQKCADILTWIKFLVQDGRYCYGLSGSLLGIELKGVRSWPVGYMTEKQMFPMDLEEFVLAIGLPNPWIDTLRQAFEQKKPLDEIVHNKMMELFHLYLVVGGMPEAVQKYVDTYDFVQVLEIQKAILGLYKHDIQLYNQGRELKIKEIFDLIPSELNTQNKRFVFKSLHDKARFDNCQNDFLWLGQADMALPTFNVEKPVYPLKLSEKRNLFKFFQNDVGLLCSQYADGVQLKLVQGQTNINYGAIYENVVAQELHAHGWDLYYFTNKKQGELDFLLERDDEIVPLEVKSGKDYERHNALTNVINNLEYDIKNAIVLCNDNLKVVDKVIYAPIYMLMFIRKQLKQTSLIYSPDLTGLV